MSVVEQDVTLKTAYAALQLTMEACEKLQRDLNGQREEEVGCPGDNVASAGPTPRLVGLLQTVGSLQSTGGNDDDSVAVLNRLVKLHSSLKISALEARRSACSFEELVKRCLRYEQLEDQVTPSAVEHLSDIPEDDCCGRCRDALCRCRLVR